MISYRVTAPSWSRYRSAELRFVAFTLASLPGIWKCVLQAVESGHPVAEDPIYTEWVNDGEVQAFIEASRREGWTFTPDNVAALLADEPRLTPVQIRKMARKERSEQRAAFRVCIPCGSKPTNPSTSAA